MHVSQKKISLAISVKIFIYIIRKDNLRLYFNPKKANIEGRLIFQIYYSENNIHDIESRKEVWNTQQKVSLNEQLVPS